MANLGFISAQGGWHADIEHQTGEEPSRKNRPMIDATGVASTSLSASVQHGSGLHLNITTIPNNRIIDIETINITGSGDNTLTLTAREVVNLSSHTNTLVVRRNAGDAVNIGTGWTARPNQTIGPDTFSVYAQGAARIYTLR